MSVVHPFLTESSMKRTNGMTMSTEKFSLSKINKNAKNNKKILTHGSKEIAR